MQNVLQKRVFNLFLYLAIAATIFQSSTPLAPDEYYLANATLILIESPDDVYFDIRNELPMPTIHYNIIDDPDYTEDISTFGYIRNSSNTDPIDVLRTYAPYTDSFNYIMSKPSPGYDYDPLYVSLRYLLPNTFLQHNEDNEDNEEDYDDDKAAFPQGGTYLISKGFMQLLTVDEEAMPCNQPWYFHVYITKDGTGNGYTVLLRAIYQMDMNPVYYCSTSNE